MLNEKFSRNSSELPQQPTQNNMSGGTPPPGTIPPEEPILGTHQKIQAEFKLKLFFLRHRKQLKLMIAGVVLIIIALIALLNAGAIRNYFDPTLKADSDNDDIVDKRDRCPGFDDNQDENKNGTPDGCDEQPPADFKIEVLSTQMFAKQGNVDVLTELKNASTEWGLREFTYTIKLLDATGGEVGRKTGISYLLPSETAPILDLAIPVSASPVTAQFELSGKKFAKTERFESLDLSVKNLKAIAPKTAVDKFQATGTASNQTPYSFEQAEIIITAVDGSENTLGATKTVVNRFDSKTQRDFRLMWNLDNFAQVAKLTARTRVNIYQSDNFINVFRSQGGRYLEYGN